jgi:hypothetical protein
MSYLDLVRLLTNSKAEILIPVDDELKITGEIPSNKWVAVTIISGVWHSENKVCEFAENEKGIGGWIVKVGFPKFAAERWTWVLVRNS